MDLGSFDVNAGCSLFDILQCSSLSTAYSQSILDLKLAVWLWNLILLSQLSVPLFKVSFHIYDFNAFLSSTVQWPRSAKLSWIKIWRVAVAPSRRSHASCTISRQTVAIKIISINDWHSSSLLPWVFFQIDVIGINVSMINLNCINEDEKTGRRSHNYAIHVSTSMHCSVASQRRLNTK